MAASHLVLVHCATAGKNGEELGFDEYQIVQFVYLLLDVANNKVVALQQHYVRPSVDDLTENILTPECLQETGIREDFVKNAQPLESVLDEMDRFLRAKGVHPDHGGNNFCICTDGDVHLRLCVHPEMCNKNFSMPPYCSTYFNMRKEFKKFYKTEQTNSIKDMLEYLGLDGAPSMEFGVRQCQEMAGIIQRLINDGHAFTDPEIIKDKLEPGICNGTDIVDDDTVVRARGLPWQSSDADIAKFFRGLNVARGGVALCLSQQGRRNGEALIRFESRDHRDLALKRHKHHLGQRYIEVYKATGKDFISVAGGNNTEAHAFLSRGGQVIIRMRGLPYTATADQVIEFFRRGDNAVQVLDGEDGILFVHQADGRATGDAFVLFGTEEEANRALGKHRELIGTRYIELFKSTTAEVQQVLNRSMDPRTPQETELPLPPLIGQIPPQTIPFLPTQAAITCGSQRDCIRIRNMPLEAAVTDILNFLAEHANNIVFQGVHMVYNAQGSPTGESFIQMNSELAAEVAAINKNKKMMISKKNRYVIDVFQCSGDDMNMVLTSGTLPPTPMQQIPSPHMQLASPLVSPRIMASDPLKELAASQAFLPPGYSAYPYSTAQFMPQPTAPAMTTMFPQTPLTQFASAGGRPSPTAAYYPGLQTAQAAQLAQLQAAGLQAAGYPTAGLQGLRAAGLQGLQSAGLQAGLQQMLYWYPSPPVSPQSAYLTQQGPSVVVMRGLPYTATLTDILSFFEGFFEITPESIQLQTNTDGRPNGDALVTFMSRGEAERAITERNRKIIGNRYIELFMA